MESMTTVPTDTVRRLTDGGWVRRDRYVPTGETHTVHVAGRGDRSPLWQHWAAGGYSCECGWCFIGASHSAAAHRSEVAR